jgi:hypothetical protein
MMLPRRIMCVSITRAQARAAFVQIASAAKSFGTCATLTRFLMKGRWIVIWS